MQTLTKDTIVGAENHFFESLNRFELLSVATKEGIWEYDFVTKQSYYNKGMFDLFGYTAAEMEDNNTWWRQNLPPDNRDEIIARLDAVYAGSETVWWGQYYFQCKNGTYKKVLDRLFIVRDADNKPIKLIGTMQDLTELDQLQNEISNIKKEHRKSIVKTMMLTQEKERKAISDELHENVNQILAAVKMRLANAESVVKEEGRARLNDAKMLLADSIKDIKTIANRLSPLTFDNFGLGVAIEDFLMSIKEKHKLQYYLYAGEGIEKADKAIQTLLFRITQWYAIQCCKLHTLKMIVVKLFAQEDKLHLNIETDILTIDISSLRKEGGYAIIVDRIDAFGGTICMEQNNHTKLLVTLPLAATF
jgi:PAS domain S-box-containing protein